MLRTMAEDETNLNLFNVNDIQGIVTEVLEACLGGNTYNSAKVSNWSSNLADKILAKLHKFNKPFKYVVRIMLTQKNGAGIHTVGAYHWDNLTDNMCTVRWENKYMLCTVIVYGLGLQ